MNKIILYSTNCPRCKILTMKLQQKNIAYEEINDVGQMTAKGFKEVPKIELADGTILDFKQAIEWVKEQNNG